MQINKDNELDKAIEEETYTEKDLLNKIDDKIDTNFSYIIPLIKNTDKELDKHRLSFFINMIIVYFVLFAFFIMLLTMHGRIVIP